MLIYYPNIPALLVELKWNLSAYTAIQQIKEKEEEVVRISQEIDVLEKEKNEISHRANALAELERLLTERK